YGNHPPCVVDSGNVEILDNVSDLPAPVQRPLSGGSASYTLNVGQPNILAGGDHPYQKLFETHCTEPGGEAVGSYWILVTGARTRGKTSVTTTPEMPILILRDPPGAQSYSFMQQDSSYCVDFGFSERKNIGLDGWVSVRAGVEVGIPF